MTCCFPLYVFFLLNIFLINLNKGQYRSGATYIAEYNEDNSVIQFVFLVIYTANLSNPEKHLVLMRRNRDFWLITIFLKKTKLRKLLIYVFFLYIVYLIISSHFKRASGLQYEGFKFFFFISDPRRLMND